MEKSNIFDLPKLPLPEELTTVLAENNNARIVRIVSTGQVSDWYDQSETEFVVLLEGNAVIEYDNGKTVALSKGDTLLIQPHEKHRVSFTSNEPPCVWLCVFY
jgi:cupin 2 domain-containing protein